MKIGELLKNTKVTVENLDACLRRSGVIVDVSFGGGRNSYKVPLKMFGVKEEQLSEKGKEFFERHAKDGTVTLIPEEEAKKFRAIEAKTHKRLNEIAIGYNGRFVPLEDFEEFVEYFDKSKKEYVEARDRLVENYAHLIERFKEILAQSMRDLDVTTASAEIADIVRKIPSKESFEGSFRVEMSVSLLPTANDFTGLNIDDATRDAIAKQYEELGRNLIGDSTVAVLQEAIDSLSSAINAYNKNGKLHYTIIRSLENCPVRMNRKNIFGNSRLEAIAKGMLDVAKSDSDEVIQQCEMLLADIYMYAKELSIQDKIDLSQTSLSPSRLESLYALYH